MENIKEKTIELTEHVEELADTFYRLAQVNLTQKAANLVSLGLTTIIVCIAGIFVLLFGGFALSWWLGDLLANRAAGFLLGAGFFLIVVIMVVLFRKKIILPFIRNLIVRKVYD